MKNGKIYEKPMITFVKIETCDIIMTSAEPSSINNIDGNSVLVGTTSSIFE